MEDCPNEKETISWASECILRYANRNIFSKEEEEPLLTRQILFSIKPNATQLPPPPAPARPSNISKVLIELINQTAFGNYSLPALTRFFATREDNITGSWYNQAYNVLSSCCMGVGQAYTYLPSCQIRYDVKKFYQSGHLKRQLPPTSLTPQIGLDESKKQMGSSYVPKTVLVPSAVALSLLPAFCFCFSKKKSDAQPASKAVDDITTTEFMKYDINAIKAATDNFSADNTIGIGSTTYKGRLQTGQEIAVKRFSSQSELVIHEFVTEIALSPRLQHRNLVRLFGYCATKEEKLLIYEFMPNLSLDRFLSDPQKRRSLVWEMRYKIIEGIAQGLLYLHEYSRYRIIHRDLKPKNILLNKDMAPMISNFRLASLLEEGETQCSTVRVVGTIGYMAPEYIISGHFSAKSDVYSFGATVLEIVSGQRIQNSFPHQEEGLLQRAWRLWNANELLEFVDPTIRENVSTEEVTRCIHIGLLCVQEQAEKRPTMASIVAELNSYNLPELPAEGYYQSYDSSSSHGTDHSTHTSQEQ